MMNAQFWWNLTLVLFVFVGLFFLIQQTMKKITSPAESSKRLEDFIFRRQLTLVSVVNISVTNVVLGGERTKKITVFSNSELQFYLNQSKKVNFGMPFSGYIFGKYFLLLDQTTVEDRYVLYVMKEIVLN